MHTIHTSLQVRRAIMRRVYYAYGLSIVLNPAIIRGFLFGASIIAFWQLVSISSIITNALNVRVGQLPTYIWQSLAHAEIFALCAFGIIVFTILSVGVKLPSLTIFNTTQSA